MKLGPAQPAWLCKLLQFSKFTSKYHTLPVQNIKRRHIIIIIYVGMYISVQGMFASFLKIHDIQSNRTLDSTFWLLKKFLSGMYRTIHCWRPVALCLKCGSSQASESTQVYKQGYFFLSKSSSNFEYTGFQQLLPKVHPVFKMYNGLEMYKMHVQLLCSDLIFILLFVRLKYGCNWRSNILWAIL